MQNNFKCIFLKQDFICETDDRKCVFACPPDCDLCENKLKEEICKQCFQVYRKQKKEFIIED